MFRDICKSFALMWDGFPHPVLLIGKNRDILDANQSARDLGVFTGVRCRDITPSPDQRKNNRQADLALEKGKSGRMPDRMAGRLKETCWAPFNSVANGLYLHFIVDLPGVNSGKAVNG